MDKHIPQFPKGLSDVRSKGSANNLASRCTDPAVAHNGVLTHGRFSHSLVTSPFSSLLAAPSSTGNDRWRRCRQRHL